MKLLFIPLTIVLSLFSTSESYAQLTLDIERSIIADFSTEKHTISFDKNFLTVKMDNLNFSSYQSDGEWLLKPAGVIVIVGGVYVGIVGLLVGALVLQYSETTGEKVGAYSAMIGGPIIGVGLIYLGSYMIRQGGLRKEKLTLK